MIASCFEYILLQVAFSPIFPKAILYNTINITANVEYTLVVNKTTKIYMYMLSVDPSHL